MEVYCESAGEVAALIQQFGGREVTAKVAARAAAHTPRHDRMLAIPGSRLSVRVVAVEPPDVLQENELVIVPGRAFGTGEHATTRMCLALMAQAASKLAAGWRVLDLGSGSGILALAARQLGAASGEGWDYDPHATRTAKMNAKLNKIRGITFKTGEIAACEATPASFDVVVANVFSEVLCAEMPRMTQWLAPGGTLIVSGILAHQAKEVRRAGTRCGIRWTPTKSDHQWVALSGRKSQAKR